MKTMTYACGLATAVTMLGGCASMHDRTTMTQTPTSSQHATVDVDYAYVAQVEQQARQRNVGIQWINPPSKRLSPDLGRH